MNIHPFSRLVSLSCQQCLHPTLETSTCGVPGEGAPLDWKGECFSKPQVNVAVAAGQL